MRIYPDPRCKDLKLSWNQVVWFLFSLKCFNICICKLWLLYTLVKLSRLNVSPHQIQTRVGQCDMFASICSISCCIAGQEWRVVASGCASVSNSVSCRATVLLSRWSRHVSGCQSTFTPVCFSCCQRCSKHLWSSVWSTSCLERVPSRWYQAAVAPCSSNLSIIIICFEQCGIFICFCEEVNKLLHSPLSTFVARYSDLSSARRMRFTGIWIPRHVYSILLTVTWGLVVC